jgi:hypothetical protein
MTTATEKRSRQENYLILKTSYRHIELGELPIRHRYAAVCETLTSYLPQWNARYRVKKCEYHHHHRKSTKTRAEIVP